MISINMKKSLVGLVYPAWTNVYRNVSKKTGVTFDTMLIGLYGNGMMNQYLDAYLENLDFFREGIKEVARLVIDDLVLNTDNSTISLNSGL